jgi:4'-phosphopantetheinyl transferase EntD
MSDPEPARGRPATGPGGPALDGLLGPDVLLAAVPLDGCEGDLDPREAALVAGMPERRRRAFAAGRAGARMLLARLGAPAEPVLRAASGAPAWPPGVVGSISHGAGWCVVAAARRGPLLGLGVDVEAIDRVGERIVQRITTEAERGRIASAAPGEAGPLGALAFAAKEALYKCAHPLVGGPLRWRDAEIEAHAAAGGEGGRLVVRPLGRSLVALAAQGDLEGGFVLWEGRVVAGVTLRSRC